MCDEWRPLVVTTTANRQGQGPVRSEATGFFGLGLARRGFLSAAMLVGLAGCSGLNLGGAEPGGGPAPTAPTAQAAPGTTIGSGSVKVALLLPLSAGGAGGPAAAGLRNAAEMAMAEFQNPDVTILVRDDGGTAEGAQAAAQAALQEGAELILGPLFADAVRGAAAVARPAGKPIMAYSTDISVATRGVYLMGFTPQASVDRIVQYAAQQGKRSYAAFVPNTPFGQVVQGAFQEAVSRSGGRVVGIEAFPPDQAGVTAAAAKLTGIAGQIDAIFVPDPYDGAALKALQTAGVDLRKVQVLGTSTWVNNRAAAQAAPNALYAAPDEAGFQTFAARYRARFNQEPARIVSLAYDSVSLIAALVRTQGTQRFSEGVLTNSSGFNGVDGLFRFRADGTPQRGLAVIQAGGRVVSPAPRSFSAGS
jgi:ABC-type branched-subunit amino acid transport system substrate-binding protein